MKEKENIEENIILTLSKDFKSGFHLIFLNYYQPLLRAANKMIGEDFAEDVVQDTFMCFWNTKKKFENQYALKSYLYQSVHNKCLNVIRKKNLQEKINLSKKEQEFFEQVIEEDLYSLLIKEIELLPEHYKNVMLRSLEGESIASIAETLDTTPDAIKAYKRRSKNILRKKLQQYSYLFSHFI